MNYKRMILDCNQLLVAFGGFLGDHYMLFVFYRTFGICYGILLFIFVIRYSCAVFRYSYSVFVILYSYALFIIHMRNS